MAYFRKRGKKWYFTMYVTNADGTKKYVERCGGTTKALCERAYREAMAAIDDTGKYEAPVHIKVAEFMDEWLEKEVEINYKSNTIDAYKSIVKKHIKPEFGKSALYDLTAAMLQDWLNSLKKDKSKSTVKRIHTVLKNAFRWAVVNREYLKINPMTNVKVPRYDVLPQETPTFTKEQISEIFARFPFEHNFYIPCMLAYHTGMRLGECLALQWSDINLSKSEIYVHSTLYDKTGLPTVSKTPKTSRSVRTIPFDVKLSQILRRWKVLQEKRSLQYGQYYKKTNFVCTREDGRQMTSNDMRYFGKWCKENFGYGSFHVFRHTHATQLIEAGIDIDYVSRRLGHSSIVTTVNFYDKITQQRHDKVKELLEKIL